MKLSRFATLIVTLALSAPLFAANRAFVSGSGVDTGTCLITAPCRSFAYGLTQITTGGEIIALDTAGYGSMTITFAASIIAAPGTTAFATAGSGNVITVAAASADTVTLRGLTVTGTGTTDGVVFSSGLSLNIENCLINGHSIGILAARSGDTSKPELQLLHCIIANNQIGLDLSNAGAFPSSHGTLRPLIAVAGPPQVYATVKDCAFLSNVDGLYTRDDANATVASTLFSANSGAGVLATGSDGHPSFVTLDGCTISRNVTGVTVGDLFASQSAHALVFFARCQITGNDTGVSVTTDGVAYSLVSNSVVTNMIIGNGINGFIANSIAAQ